MEEIKKMSFADLKAMFDYCRLILDDAIEEKDKKKIIEIEPILSALNDEMDLRSYKIVKLLKP
jgi:hypothetical protein